MSFGESIAPVIGRCMLAALFVLAGVNKIQHWDEAASSMAAQGISAEGPLLALAVVIEIGAGLGLAAGFRTKLMALVLFLFTLAVSFVMHDFWTITDNAELARTEMQLFAKNMAIAGGLLVLVGMGAGRLSFDGWRGEEE
jgi:putative oxidoreductase